MVVGASTNATNPSFIYSFDLSGWEKEAYPHLFPFPFPFPAEDLVGATLYSPPKSHQRGHSYIPSSPLSFTWNTRPASYIHPYADGSQLHLPSYKIRCDGIGVSCRFKGDAEGLAGVGGRGGG